MIAEMAKLAFEDDVVKLEPFELKKDLQTVLDLVMKCRYTRVPREAALKALLRFNTMMWYVRTKKENALIGVIYLTNTPGGWMLDAYRDEDVAIFLDNAADCSYRAGKFITDFAMKFTNRLLTVHAFENRGATQVCKKFGFKEDFIIMKKER